MERGIGVRSGVAWAIGIAVAAVLCALAVVAWAVVPAGERAVLAASGGHGSASTEPTPSPSAAGVVTTGPRLPDLTAGLLVQAALAANGELLVNERLALPTGVLAPQLIVRMESVVSGPGIPAGTHGEPAVSGLQFALDSQVVAVPPAAMINGLRTWTIPTKSARGTTHVLQARYQVTGASVRSTPAPAGRVTVVLAPLLDSLVGAAPAYLSVAGPSGSGEVLGVNCPLAPSAQIVCGDKRSDGWVVQFGPGRARACVG